MRTPQETLAEAQDLLDAGRPFHAHEVFEDAWKSTDGPDRELWRGLAQLAVGMTHALRGNSTGASALLERGAENVEPYRESPPHGIDVAGLQTWARALAAEVKHRARAEPASPRLTG